MPHRAVLVLALVASVGSFARVRSLRRLVIVLFSHYILRMLRQMVCLVRSTGKLRANIALRG